LQTNEAKSSGSTKKWLTGCAIGCGAIILILILLGVSGFFFIKNIVQEFKDTEALMSTLTERYGRIKDYCPDPDGAIRSERIEAFLSARDAFAPARKKLETTLETLSEGKIEREIEVKTPKNVFKMIKLGFGVIPQISEYFKSRNQALLDAEMGMGEYYFIYVVAYYSWLKKPPEDGPDFQLVGQSEDYDYWDEEVELEARRDRLLKRVHRMTLPMLHNQFEKLTSGNITGVQNKWRRILASEIKAMESDRFRLPWQDGLPAILEASLRSFREQLEASYSTMTNPLEVALEQR